MGSSLKIIIVVGAILILAGSSQAEIYYSEFKTSAPIDNYIEFSVSPADYQVISAEVNGRMWPVNQQQGNIYSITGFGILEKGATVKVLYNTPGDASVDRIDIEFKGSGNTINYDGLPGLTLDLIPLQSVTDTLESAVAGDNDVHTIGFNISTNQIQEKGEIWITFPAGFDVGGLVLLDSISYSDDDATNDGNEPTIDSIQVITRTVIIKLDSGTPAATNSRINIEIRGVNNAITAGDYSVTVQTLDSLGTSIHIPTASDNFTIEPDSLVSVIVSPSSDLSLPSDSIVVFSAAGEDQYSNEISGLTFTWAITVDSCGLINNGTFRADKLGECYITASTGGITDSSGLLTITAGDLDRFGMTGYPSSVTAGQLFPSPIKITAYDVNDNIIYNLTDSIYFFSDDDSASFTYDSDNWLDIDTGQVSIAGSNFVLKLAGSKTISVTNGTETTTSPGITVSPTIISDFSFNTINQQTAGVSFALSISDAVDQYGNAANGSVVIDAQTGGGNSPNGNPPAYGNISVLNGAGSANQVLTNATTTILRGVGGSATILTNSFEVSPGVVGELILTDCPDTVTAGVEFSTDPTVTVKDIFGNLKTNYDGTIHFAGASTMPDSFTFTPTHDGDEVFSGSDFAFETVGIQRLYVYDSDSSLADTSGAIEVYADEVVSFTLSAIGTVNAGTAFALNVSSAVDQYGNPASGTIVVSDSSGAGNSPDGTAPSLNNITVTNGAGSSQQILVDAGTAIIKGSYSVPVFETVTIDVEPSSNIELTLTDYPDSITAGLAFSTQSLNPTVTVTDIYGNAADNYTGTVGFTNIEHADGAHTFSSGDNGEYTYDGSAFSFETSGSRKFFASDGTLADTSSVIEVYPAAIDTFTLSAQSSVTAGTAFTLTVSNAKDEFDNDASGTVVVADSIGAGNSPDGTAPSLNNIIVTNGSGTAQQVLVDSIAVAVLKGTVGLVVGATGNITVVPANAAELVLSNYPDTITAGQTFPSPSNDPLVTLKDTYGNLATTYGGTVTLSNADSDDLNHLFTSGHDGTYSFDGDLIYFNSVGLHTIIVTDDTYGLTDTSSPIQVVSTTISSFDISAPDSVDAGVGFTLSVSNVLDQYGNPTSGVISVSGVSGTGNAPDGSSPTLNDITVSNGSGTSQQVLVLTGDARIRGLAGGAADTTDIITVHPGVLGSISLTSYPDTVTAGDGFSTDPEVTVYDMYLNVTTDYTGTVSFSGITNLPSDYTFVGGDSGHHTFNRGDFIPEEAGLKKLIVSENLASMADTSNQIQVNPDVIDAFTFDAVGSVTAGVPFTLTISNAVDQFNNDASGLIDVDTVGQAISPNGDTPIINDIVVTNGSGSAQQTLVRTGSSVRLRGTYNSSIADTTNTFTVNPGVLGELDVAIASPQVSGVPFTSPSTITAFDAFGNTKTDFQAASDTVLMTASNGGDLSNNILNDNTDFSSGIADLNALSVTYNGAGGQVVFMATSESGVSGESNVVQIGSIRADTIWLDEAQVVRGDTARGTVRVTNLGNVAANITDIDIKTETEQFNPIFDPSLGSIPGGSNTEYDFKFVVSTLSPGSYPLTMIVNAEYSSIVTADTLIGADTIIIVTESNLADVSNTLSPDTVSREESYGLSVYVTNGGGTGLNLVDSSYVTFTDGSETYLAELSQNSFINVNDTTLLTFNSETISSTFTPGSYSVNFMIYGYDVHGVVSDLITLSDGILVQSRTSISYLGDISPTILLTDSEITLSARVTNGGQADLLINPDLTKITFNDGTRQFIAYIDTSSDVFIESITGGTDTTLTFVPELLLPDFVPDAYTPIITVAGTQNEKDYSISISTAEINVYNPGEVRIDSLYTVSYNSPKVNVNQNFTVHGFISNLGDENVDSARVMLVTDGNSDISGDFGDTLYIGAITAHSGVAFDYSVEAAEDPNLLEAFYCDVTYAVNEVSRAQAPVATPLDNSTVAIIESEATLELDTLYLSDDSISTGQDFTVYARVSHDGSNSYDGTDQLTIDFDGDSGFDVDSLQRNFSIGQLVSWIVTAPTGERNLATVNISFNGEIIDLNDSSTALGSDSTLSIDVVVTDKAAITHRAMIVSPDGATDSVFSTGQSLVVADSLFPTGNTAASYARLILPEGFSSTDPLTQELAGNVVEWGIIACEQVVTDSLGFECWSFDSNTGDSTSDEIIWIDIEVENKATFSLNSSVTYPPSAVDRIISPGAEFTFHATASNIGDAEAGTGELTLRFGHDGFTIAEDSIRTFTPGTPVEWNLTAPDEQITDGVVISVIMTEVPNDLNTGQSSITLTDSIGMEVIIKRELPDLVLSEQTAMGGAVIAGQSIDIYRLTFYNSTEITKDKIGIFTFGYRLKSDGVVIDPSDVISASTVTLNDNEFAGTLSDSTISLTVDPTLMLEPDSTLTIMINVTPIENPAYTSFNVGFQSSDILARVIVEDTPDQRVEVILPDGDEFDLVSTTLATLEDDFNTSTKVNQNPFIASQGNLNIGYNLENDATLEVKIYNINGDVVWEFAGDLANGYGSAGQHYDDTAIPWDGRNSKGDKVLSGVYYIFVSNTTTGQNTNMKVAVIW